MPRCLILRVLLAFLLSGGTAFAQSLADVLSSIQERKAAVEQAKQVEAYLQNTYGGGSGPIPDQELISWNGSLTPYPSAQNLGGLSMDAKLALLNQAIDEFRRLQPHFANIRKEHLGVEAEIGAIRPFLPGDFPDHGRADALNYHAVLATLARDVRRLAVLPWPVAGNMETKNYHLRKFETIEWDEYDEPYVAGPFYGEGSDEVEGWFPSSLKPGNVTGEEWKIAKSGWSQMLGERYHYQALSDTDHDYDYGFGLRKLWADTTHVYCKEAALFAKVPGEAGQLDGMVALAFRNQWSPVDMDTVQITAPNSWDPADSGFEVILAASDAASNFPTGGSVSIEIQLNWIRLGSSLQGPYDEWHDGVPFGYGATKAWLGGTADLEDETDDSDWLNSWEYHQGLGPSTIAAFGTDITVFRRQLHALCAPKFTKGLDIAATRANLSLAEATMCPTPGDALPMLNPVPGIILGIPLGVGLDGNTTGYIGISPNEEECCGKSATLYPQTSENRLVTRFDAASSLRFIGPAGDFHVVYATTRNAAGRGQMLPENGPTDEEKEAMGGIDFFDSWDAPRLRQIVSRDFIVDVTQRGHYENEVKIYRRPLTSGINRNPGALATATGELLHTWTCKNPSATGDPYAVGFEALHLDNGATNWRATRDGFPTDRENPDPAILWEMREGANTRISKNISFPSVEEASISTSLDGIAASATIAGGDWRWWDGASPGTFTLTAGARTTVVTNTFDNAAAGSQQGRYPSQTTIATTNEPDIVFVWNTSGRLNSEAQGAWRTDYSIAGDALKAQSKFNGAVYATTWTEWSGHDRVIKSYGAPDGAIGDKGDPAVDSTELTLGDASGSGLPGLPHSLTRKDGSAAKWTWAVSGIDHSGNVTLETGVFSGGSLATGQRQTTAWNSRSFTTSSETEFVAGGSLAVSSFAVPSGQSNSWGAPQQWKSLLSGFATHIAYDGLLTRPASITSPLGLATGFSNYDVFDRAKTVQSNGITAQNTFAGLGVNTSYSGTGVVSGSQSSFTRNIEGTNVSHGLTWGGVEQSSGINRGASATTLSASHGLFGGSTATLRNADGSLSSAIGPALAFGGLSGDSLSIVNGLFVTKSTVADQSGTFAESHTDAWGRVRKVVTPAASGSGSAETSFGYSLPSSTLKRVITTEPTGRILISESDAAGTVTRSGIDVNGNGSLGATDRYTESVVEVGNSKVTTTLSVTEDTGLREVLRSEWTPATGIQVTKVNGNEETITTTPDYQAKTVTTSSSKGWSRVTTVNSLGLATANTLSGTGIATTSLTPVWRADGSLESVSLQSGGETHTAGFNPDGTLASLTAPGRGNILGGHSISGGAETLTLGGTTRTHSLDGTSNAVSGSEVIAKTEVLDTAGSGYESTVTPAVGEPTTTAYNAALAPTGKFYADDTEENYAYQGNLLSSVTLARGGAIAFDYSNDGAKDLASATWPSVSSGPFTIAGFGQGFGYSRSGQIKTLSDPSGTRSLAYANGRLAGTAYTSGPLKGYEVLRSSDASGRDLGSVLERDGAVIHTTAKAPNGASDQITNLASGNLTATPQRDGEGRITGYVWSDGTNSVTQTWTRGPGGRIEFAGSDVSGAPSFTYLLDPQDPAASFDSQNRRLKCQTAGGTWTYAYGTGGQLVSATHPTLGTFTYAFDGIGRRTDKGTANTTDLLNRSTAWTHSQDRTLTIKAHPDARVWFNGVEIPNFTGTHQASITPPGTDGGWVPYETLAVLEGQGEGAGNPPPNPLASPDAKAEHSGAVWVPPLAETLAYDAAGNRQSSAQWDFGWDAKNQLIRARTKNHGSAPQAHDLTFTYDAEGRRVRKHVIEYSGGAVVSEKIITFVWDGWDLLYERHQLPSGLTLLERKYLWGPDIADGAAGGAGGLLLIRETKGNTTTNLIPLYDGTGHVIGLTNLNKDLLASYAYGPFGEKISSNGPNAQSNPWRWATKYQDEETGLCYFGLRYYDPVTGQWLSREPLGESESVNLYAYCHNDPLNKVDVLGAEEKDVRQHIDQAQKHLIQLTLAMAGLAGSKEEDFDQAAQEIEAIYGQYLGSLNAGQDELAKFMREGWFLSCRSADDVLAADLANFNVNLGGGLMPDGDFLRANQATANRTIAELDSQITALDRAILACQITEGTCDLVMLGTGLGSGGVAVRKVIISQGGKQAAKLVLRGMAQAGGGLAVGLLTQEAMIQAGISKDKAKLVMKGAELFFAWKMLKVARAANAIPPAAAHNVIPVSPTPNNLVYRFATRGQPATLQSNLSRAGGWTQARVRLQMRIPGYKAWRARRHMNGDTRNSPFVSVLSDPGAGAASPDPWLRTIITGRPGVPGVVRAPDLGTFAVPQRRLFDPEPGTFQALETERLFLGDDLGDFLQVWQSNPF